MTEKDPAETPEPSSDSEKKHRLVIKAPDAPVAGRPRKTANRLSPGHDDAEANDVFARLAYRP